MLKHELDFWEQMPQNILTGCMGSGSGKSNNIIIGALVEFSLSKIFISFTLL